MPETATIKGTVNGCQDTDNTERRGIVRRHAHRNRFNTTGGNNCLALFGAQPATSATSTLQVIWKPAKGQAFSPVDPTTLKPMTKVHLHGNIGGFFTVQEDNSVGNANATEGAWTGGAYGAFQFGGPVQHGRHDVGNQHELHRRRGRDQRVVEHHDPARHHDVGLALLRSRDRVRKRSVSGRSRSVTGTSVATFGDAGGPPPGTSIFRCGIVRALRVGDAETSMVLRAENEAVTRWEQAGVPRGDRYDERFRELEAAASTCMGKRAVSRRCSVSKASRRPARVAAVGARRRCGTGRVAIEPRRAGFDIVGVDLDPMMLDKARRKAPHLEWVLSDLPSCGSARFEAAVLAGNVMIFVGPGTEARRAHAIATTRPRRPLGRRFQLTGRLPLDDVRRGRRRGGARAGGAVRDLGSRAFDDGDYVVGVHRRRAG